MLIFIYGGSASGKSEYAETLAVSLAGTGVPLCYLATMEANDEESRQRAARHQAARKGKGFSTIEQPLHLENAGSPSGAVILVECLSTLTANEMFRPDGVGAHAVSAICSGISALQKRAGHVLIVSCDVFRDGGRYDAPTQEYLRNLGALHCRLAQHADMVWEVVASIPLLRKGGQP